jgi:hypothetical protein
MGSQPVAPGDETEWAEGLLQSQADLSQRLDCLASELGRVSARLAESATNERLLRAKLASILQLLESRQSSDCRRI